MPLPRRPIPSPLRSNQVRPDSFIESAQAYSRGVTATEVATSISELTRQMRREMEAQSLRALDEALTHRETTNSPFARNVDVAFNLDEITIQHTEGAPVAELNMPNANTVTVCNNCIQHISLTINSVEQSENPFLIDSDWWWIYEALYRPTDCSAHLLEGYWRSVSREAATNYINQYQNPTSGARQTHVSSYNWRNSRGGPLQDYVPITRKNFRAAARSLLYLCRRLKAEGEELVADQSATFWVWFTKTINYLANRDWHQMPVSERGLSNVAFGQYLLRNKILERIARITNISLICDLHGGKYYLKSTAKSYWTSSGLAWTRQANWEARKAEGQICWAADVKEWINSDATIEVYNIIEKNNNQQVCETAAYLPFTKNKFKECPMCHYWWYKQWIKPNKWIENDCCYACTKKYQSTPTNPAHNFDSIFSGYHSHRRWMFYNQRLNEKDQTLPIGVECEMSLKQNSPDNVPPTMWKLYEHQLNKNPKWHNFYSESDGSLGSSGVEMITNPMTVAFHQQYWEHMLPEMRKYLCGWNATDFGGTSYGIHLTSHRKYWRDFHLARLMKFVESQENQQFIYAIAQRRGLYGGATVAGYHKPKITELATIENKKLKNSSRGSAVYLKQNDLVEVRMFASTLNPESFLKNIEFVDSFWHWCKETSYSVFFGDYLKWLFNHHTHEKRYPNLIQYVQRKKFGCKYGPAVINTWQQYLVTKPLGQLNLFNEIEPAIEDRIECA